MNRIIVRTPRYDNANNRLCDPMCRMIGTNHAGECRGANDIGQRDRYTMKRSFGVATKRAWKKAGRPGSLKSFRRDPWRAS